MLLTDDGALQHRISHPLHKQWKTYWVQVEGTPPAAQVQALGDGPVLSDGPTLAVQDREIAPPALWHRDPPIRVRQSIPTSWLALRIREGRNRQVRRMTAALGLPTLRLIRVATGDWVLGDLVPGDVRVIEAQPQIPRTDTRTKHHRQTKRPEVTDDGKPVHLVQRRRLRTLSHHRGALHVP